MCPHHKKNNLKQTQKSQDIFLRELTLGLPKRFEDVRILNWQDELHPSRAGKVSSVKLLSIIESKLEELILNPSNKVRGVFLYGEPGVGKTFALAALHNEIIKNNVARSAFINYPRFLGQSKRLFTDPVRRHRLINILTKVPVLFLDDIGSEQATDNPDYSWAQDELYQLIDYRHDEFLFTSFSTNVHPQELENRFKKTLISRMLGMTQAYSCQGDDIRPHLIINVNKKRK